MTTRAEQARLFNQAISQGLSEDQALRVAGITSFDDFTYDSRTGQLVPVALGPGRRPNETIVPPGANIDDGDDDDERQFVTRPVSSQTTTTNQTTVTGGSVTTRAVTPTTYKDTAESTALQSQASSLEAQKQARAAELRAQGKTGAQVINDPEYRRLSREAQDKETAAQNAKAVDQAGTVTTTVSPGPTETDFSQTVDAGYQTQRTSGDDAEVETQQVNRVSSSGDQVENTAPGTVVNPDGPGQGFVTDPDTGELIPADSAAAQEILAQERRVENTAAANPGRNLSAAFDPETQTYGVWDNDTGVFLETGLTEQEAIIRAQDGSLEDLPQRPVPITDIRSEPSAVDDTYTVAPDENGTFGVWSNSTGVFVVQGLTEQEAQLRADELNAGATLDPETGLTDTAAQRAQDAAAAAANEAAIREKARVQAILANQLRQADEGDWRLKIRLAPGAKYLYRGDDGQGVQSGILAPLAVTDGVIFPYTPNITTAYRARYAEQDLPHSNYRGYFYSGSHVEEINIQSVFTAQDTGEANYMLAVIHFFRSVTKMFYGQQDQFRGAPPPLVFLQGFGAYQFARHPCVVTGFNYNLPADVDYIRADVQPISGLNIQQARERASVPTNVFAGALGRLQNAGLSKGGRREQPAAETLGTIVPTYVPTKIEMTIVLLPMQTRQQVSREFSLRDFANGSLIRKGFW